MKFKLTRMEKNWVLYDVGNSAFTLMVSTIMPIYFNYLAGKESISSVDYMAYWGYAASIATLIVALLGPIVGTLTDTKGFKKPIFTISIFVGTLSCVGLGFAQQWLAFLIIYIIAKIGFSSSLIFYDSMLGDVTTEARMDNVSSQGFAWGYIGSCVPFIACLSIVLGSEKLGLTMEGSMLIAFMIVAFWWLLMSLPLLNSYKQKFFVERKEHAVLDSFKRLNNTFRNVKKEKKIFVFLLAFFFYIDGVYTIIDMATAYGSALGLDSTGLLLALLATQLVAFPFALLFGRLSNRIDSAKLITICILAYLGIAIYAMFLKSQLQFWILAICVGMFQGGIQALSRSYFTKIIPQEQSGEYFGLMDICGKGASFIGTAVVGFLSQLTGDVNKGVGAIAIFFVIGIVLFRLSVKLNQNEIYTNEENTIETTTEENTFFTMVSDSN